MYLLIKKSDIKKYLISLLLLIPGFILTRHINLKFLSPYMAPVICLMVLLGVKISRDLLILIPITIYSLCSLFYSIIIGGSIADSLRFFTIIIFTLLAFFYKSSIVKNKYILLIPFILQGLFITSLSFYLTLSYDEGLVATIRQYFLSTDYGDVYSNGYYYKVQVIGNALIPLVFYICLSNFNKKLYKYSAGFMAIAVFICGNLSYIITASLAILLFLPKGKKYVNVIGIIIVSACIYFFYDPIVAKFIQPLSIDGGSSMDLRFIQINHIYHKMFNSSENILFGYGLGASLGGEYALAKYIELQSLYFVYQIGLVGILIYLSTIWILMIKFLSKEGIKIFLLYIMGSILNPYLFDSNQILATLIIVIFFSKPIRI